MNRVKAKNVRKSHGKKKIKLNVEIQVPRDRDASFNLMIILKRESIVKGIEEVIISLYAQSVSVSDIEEQIKDVYKFEVSTATISQISFRMAENMIALQNRSLDLV